MFAALGEPTRLGLLDRLGDGAPRSISHPGARPADLAPGADQAFARARRRRTGQRRARRAARRLYRIDPAGLLAAEAWIGTVSRQWDAAIDRLKRHVEE